MFNIRGRRVGETELKSSPFLDFVRIGLDSKWLLDYLFCPNQISVQNWRKRMNEPRRGSLTIFD